MELVIQSRNVDLDESARTYIERKLSRLARHLPSLREAVVEITRESVRDQQGRVVAQVTMDVNGTVLRGEERAATVRAAVDALADVADRRLARYKGRAYRTEQARRAARRAAQGSSATGLSIEQETSTEATSEGVEEEGELEERLVRVKQFAAKPMTTEDAIERMELVGHDFFLFLNSASGQFNVVYRRRSGGYGLLQPQV
ncbi:MAG: ribosome-associated translation inhibitor RaiA [Chloroflexi bacterium]|nr:ribosome-associated translation inhibitor RaiA [Chloroflexota bacterium]